MKYYIYTVLLLLLTASCSDDVQKWDQWPEWKLASPLSVGGQVLDEEIYSNFQGKKLHLEKGQEVEFSGIDEIESILSPDYFEYVSENKARFKGETADYSVLYDPANELLYIEKAGATYPDGLWFCGANWGHPQARLVTTSGWSMDGPWKERTFSGPNVKDGTDRPGARHGCIVKVNETVYQALLKAYKK